MDRRVTVQQASSPQQVQTPSFRTRVDLVRTDVAVIDNKTGRSVTGLTDRDFAVTENGVRQTITSFLAEAGSAQGEVAAVGGTSVTRSRRVFLIVFGSGRLDSAAVRPYDGVIWFLKERLRPNDLVALMALNRITEFTTEHTRLVPIVERLRRVPAGVWDRWREDSRKGVDVSDETQAAIDALFQRPAERNLGIRSAAALLLGTTDYRQNESRWHPWNRGIAAFDHLKVSAGIEHLRTLEGERHLILLTRTGIEPPRSIVNMNLPRFDSREDDRRFTARASEAQIALDIILTSGAATNLAMPTPAGGTNRVKFPGVQLRQSSQEMADFTGGQFTSLRTAADQLARIDDATRNGYVLGYLPTNPELDGKYRTVVVTVNRKGVTVVYRRGYTARPDLPPIDPRELLTETRLGEAATGDLPLDDIKLKAEAALVTGTGGTRQVRVEMKIDPSTLVLSQANGKREGSIDLLILCGDVKQDVVGQVHQKLKLSIDETQYRQHVASGGIPYSALVPVSGAALHVKVIVYDYASDRTGMANVRLK
jgi:VWFA-related protein